MLDSNRWLGYEGDTASNWCRCVPFGASLCLLLSPIPFRSHLHYPLQSTFPGAFSSFPSFKPQSLSYVWYTIAYPNARLDDSTRDGSIGGRTGISSSELECQVCKSICFVYFLLSLIILFDSGRYVLLSLVLLPSPIQRNTPHL